MNDRSEKLVYRKTEAGVAEVKTRKAGLDSKTRTLLILVNGAMSVNDLAGHIGYDPRPALENLAASGFVERVDAVAARQQQRAAAITAAPVTSGVTATPPVTVAATPAAPPPAAPALNLGPACQRAVQMLVPLYGPDAMTVVQPLLKSRSLDDFHKALGELEHKLSVPVGKKRAQELVSQIRGAAR